MSDDTKALVARLRRWHSEGGSLTARDAADTIERLERDRDAIAERCEKLREALVRVRAHTSYLRDAERDLLVGLLASIERITDTALRAAPKDAP